MSGAAAGWTCATCGSAYPADFTVCPRDATPRRDAPVPGDPMIGVVLGGAYRIVRVLGEGGMARLYEAEHLRVADRFAIKVIHDDLAREADLLARFEREARAAGRVKSPHVLGVIDVLRTADGRPCIVSELLAGEDLQAYLDRTGKMSPAAAIPLVRQVCRALAAAHACGVVHRDLKPSNVFLCRGQGGETLVKVLDFGVAKVADDGQLTRTGVVVGTPSYMSPEQARRAADAGPPADLYAAGALLYHMVTGEPPYGADPIVSPMVLLLEGEPARPRSIEPSIPEGVETVIQHAMARDPAARPASAVELDAELSVFDVGGAALALAQGSTSPVAPAAAGAGAGAGAAHKATAVLPPAQVDESTVRLTLDMARRAQLARPVAVGLAMAATVVAGLWTAMLVSALLGAGPRTVTERWLIGVLAVAAAGGAGALETRILMTRWNSSPAVMQHGTVVGHALLAGLCALGALELAAHGLSLVSRAFALPAWMRVIAAAAAALLGLGWRRYSLGPRLRKLIALLR